MLAIRFNRVGKKNRTYFRIALQEHTVAPGGKHIEVLGSWDPCQKKGIFKSERIKYWLSKGVQPSDSVYNLLVKQGIIKGKKRAVKISKKIRKAEKREKPVSAKVKAEAKKEEAKKGEVKKGEKDEKEKTKEVKPEEKK